VRELGRIVLARLASTKFEPTLYEDALDEELKKHDLNRIDFRRDIVRTFVRADLATRAKVDPLTVDEDGHIQPELFEPTQFARGVIRLGNGQVIGMAYASGIDWVARSLHQQRAAEAAQHAATKTTLWLQTQPGLMLLENPKLKTYESMHWPEDALIIESETDDDGGES
jgi:hypothetical protein